MARYIHALVLVLMLAAFTCGQDRDRLGTWQAKAYPLIKPADSELAWKQIPWLTDLEDAIKAAKVEKRPLLLWTAGDDPLERC